MNALHEKYAKSGLVILGVSDEGESLLTDWVEKRKAKYPIVSAPSGARTYGVSGYPTYYLVSASGRVLAGPQHGHFSEAQIEDALKSVVLFTEPPKGSKFDGLRKAQSKEEFAGMTREIAKLRQDASLSAEEKAAVEVIRGEVAKATEFAQVEIASLRKGPDYLASLDRLKELGSTFKGTPVEAEIKAATSHIKGDKTIAAEIRALKELAAYQRRYDIKKSSGKKKLIKALTTFIKKRSGTHAATKAEALLARASKEP